MKRLALVPLLALALTACGPHNPLDVTMRGVSITVPRALAPVVTLVPPPVQPLPVDLPLPLLPPLPPLPPPPPPAPECPKASQLAVPDQPVSITLAGRPQPGVSVQRSDGSYAGSTASPSDGSLKGTVTTTVTHLPDTTSVVGQALHAWTVAHTDNVTKTVSLEVYQLADESTAPGATTPGIYLIGLAWDDPVRGSVTFQPVGGGVTILPLPVSLAGPLPVQFASSQTDPDSLTTLTLAGIVTGKKRVDVCGTVVDTYTVALTGTLSSPGAQRQVAWRQQLATQYGGAEIEDELTLTDATGAFSWHRTLLNNTVPKQYLPKDPA